MVDDEFSVECLVALKLVRLQIIMPLTHHRYEQVPAFIYTKGNRENEECVHAYGAVTLAFTYYCCTNPRGYPLSLSLPLPVFHVYL